jgi:chromosome segregation ATPase
MALPVALLAEQRNRVLAELERVQHELQQQRTVLLEEHDAFIAFLMTEHETKLGDLSRELDSANERVARKEALLGAPVARSTEPAVESNLAARTQEIEERVLVLQEQLQDAFREVDEARAESARLQEERDESIRAIDDVQTEMADRIDAARDEAFELERQRDEADRRVQDIVDEARDEMFRLTEELDTAKREIDERRAEVRRLRERIDEMTGDVRHSRPPPPPGSAELDLARNEITSLRKQLIEAKRELSRVRRELDAGRTAPPGRPRLPSPASSRSGSAPPRKSTLTGVPAVSNEAAEAARKTRD